MGSCSFHFILVIDFNKGKSAKILVNAAKFVDINLNDNVCKILLHKVKLLKREKKNVKTGWTLVLRKPICFKVPAFLGRNIHNASQSLHRQEEAQT